MVNDLTASPEQLDRLFMALADRSRRTILATLAERGSLSVGDASAALALSPAGVTKHVKMLEEAGLVHRRLDGRRHVLSLETERLLLAEDWIERYRQTWSTSIARLADLAAEIERTGIAVERDGSGR
jgi:DNA-binding transcriptional ArsR family regulator